MSGSSRSRWLSLAALAAVAVALALFSSRKTARPAVLPPPGIPTAPAPAAHPTEAPAAPAALFGERILARYADPARPPEDDLHGIARTLANFALLVKGDNPIPLGANEEIAAALRGKNRAKLRSLPDEHRAFNAAGQLVDRWGTALFFHAQSRDRIDIRSAGPDRKMWTADDLHRTPDGRFLRGEALLAPSLFDESARPGR